MNDKNSIVIGLAAGAIIPVLGYFAIEFIFDSLSSYGLMDSGGTGYYSKRFRSLALFAICCNLIPLNYFKRQRWDEAMKGVVFPTLIYAGFWVYKYMSIIL